MKLIRALLLACSVILVLGGLAVFAISNSVIEKPHNDEVASVGNQYEVSGVFDRYDKLLVYFPRPNPEVYPDSSIKIYVEITDPGKNKTVFEIQFGRMFGQPAPPNITLVSNEGSLIVSEPPLTEVGGIVDYPGAYVVHLSEYWGGPPTTLTLYKEIVDKEYPYRNIFPVGLVLVIVGASLFILGAKRPKRKQKLK